VIVVIGAISGAVTGGLISIFIAFFNARRERRRAVEAQRLNLAREVMRYRGDPERLVPSLNELPLLFGEDAEVMRLHRNLRLKQDANSALKYLVQRLAALTGLHDNVKQDDIDNPFRFSGNESAPDGGSTDGGRAAAPDAP
jgi:hypothetical protein